MQPKVLLIFQICDFSETLLIMKVVPITYHGYGVLNKQNQT